ncbi:MAG TPA: VCBS repeat-containing protein, partial [Puia sp.]|nr:VCBS repeat-containing protein [Puia sp.]
DQVLSPEQREGAVILQANDFQTSFIRNDGHGKFSIMPLPVQAQFSVINGMVAGDFDGDGNLDLVMNGNDYGTEVSTGRYDAFNGLFLKGDGKGNFSPESILQSGIFIPGNGKALAELRDANGHAMVVAGQNRGPLRIFEAKRDLKTVSTLPADVAALLRLRNGKSRRQEFYYGSSFLSQSTRVLDIDGNILSAEIIDEKGKRRSVALP